MLEKIRKFNLQYFAESAEGGTGAVEASPGVSAADAGQPSGVNESVAAGQNEQPQARSLEELGVPKAKAERYRALKGKKNAAPSAAPADTTVATDEPQTEESKQEEPTGQAAAAEAKDEGEKNTQQNTRLSWAELMKDPEYSREMQKTVSSRVKAMQSQIEAVSPLLELVGRKYSIDAKDISKADLNALAAAVRADDYFYEDFAEQHGDVATAKRNIQAEIDQNARGRALDIKESQLNETIEEMTIRQHFSKLQAEATELKKKFPDFDLEAEMNNSRFINMTSPAGGLSVEQAYVALHYKEIMAAKEVEDARRYSQAMSRAVQSGRSMPRENGTKGKGNGGTVTEKPYSQMNTEERRAWLARAKQDPRARL